MTGLSTPNSCFNKLVISRSPPIFRTNHASGSMFHSSPSASNTSRDIRQADPLPGLARSRNRDHGAHRGQAVFDTSADHRGTVQNGVGEAFDLSLIAVSILPERAMVLAILCRETLDVARLV